jgi:hypothetical protein
MQSAGLKGATSGLIDNANKTVFQLTLQKRVLRIFAVQGA